MILAVPELFEEGEWGNVYLKEGTIDIASRSFDDYGSYPMSKKVVFGVNVSF